jgi:mRNA interferase RelE/StbE
LKYKIEVKRSAAKALKKIPKPDQKRISKAIDNLAENLPNPETTKMKGNNPFHKIRVGDYRIVYEIQDDILLIFIFKIGRRKDIYRNLT